jgi:rubrerythrin
VDIFDFAMKMEVDGKTLYEGIAKRTSHAGLANIFSMLADDEQKHYDTLLDMKNECEKSSMVDSKVLESAKNIFEELVIGKERLDSMKEDLDGYLLAMKIEADSVRFYEDAAAREARDNVKSLLLRIAEEEKKHYNIVENIYDFVLRPKYFLAWREFSNLKEF